MGGGDGEGKERDRKVSDESAHGIVPDIHGERRHRRRMRDREERDNETVLYYVPGDDSSLSLSSSYLSINRCFFLYIYRIYTGSICFRLIKSRVSRDRSNLEKEREREREDETRFRFTHDVH